MRIVSLCLVVIGLAVGLWFLQGCGDSPTGNENGKPDTDGPADPIQPEPSPKPEAWADIEATLAEKPDPVAVQTRKDLEAAKLAPNFEDAPLDEAARYLSGLTKHEVAVVPSTWEVFSRQELWITAKSKEITLVETLDLICAEMQLAWWIEGEKVKIAPTPPRTEVVTITYPIENLTTGEKPYQPDAIADMIRDRTDQEVWDEDGEVQYQGPGKGLLVTAPKATQRKVLTLLRELLKR